MALDREALITELVTRLGTITGMTVSRKVRVFDQVSPAEHPCLFVATESHEPINELGKPTIWKLNLTLYLYAYDSENPPDAKLNGYIKDVESCLEMQPGETRSASARFHDSYSRTTTLGGLASHVFISGPIQTDGGGLGDQAVAIIPIEILSVA